MRRHTSEAQGSSIIMLNGTLYKITLEKLSMRLNDDDIPREDTREEVKEEPQPQPTLVEPTSEPQEEDIMELLKPVNQPLEEEEDEEHKPSKRSTTKLEKGPTILNEDGGKTYIYYRTNTRTLKNGEVKQTRTEIRRTYKPKPRKEREEGRE